jgi:hypothetical protein
MMQEMQKGAMSVIKPSWVGDENEANEKNMRVHD